MIAADQRVHLDMHAVSRGRPDQHHSRLPLVLSCRTASAADDGGSLGEGTTAACGDGHSTWELPDNGHDVCRAFDLVLCPSFRAVVATVSRLSTCDTCSRQRTWTCFEAAANGALSLCTRISGQCHAGDCAISRAGLRAAACALQSAHCRKHESLCPAVASAADDRPRPLWRRRLHLRASGWTTCAARRRTSQWWLGKFRDSGRSCTVSATWAGSDTYLGRARF